MTTPALRPYQRAGAEWLTGRRFAILADATGMGKTPQYLAAAAGFARVLIIAPAATLPGLAREVLRWTGREAITLDHAGRVRVPLAGPCVVLLAWTSARQRVAGCTLGARWDVLILDEAHFAKNPTSRRTKAVLGQWRKRGATYGPGDCIRAHADRCWAMTATPVPNRPIEIQPLLHLAGGLPWAALAPFGSRYCEQFNKFAPQGFDYNGAKNLDELRGKLDAAGVLLRRLPEDVPGELPELAVAVVPLSGVREPTLARGLASAPILASIDAGASPAVAFEDLSAYRAAVGLAKAPAVVAWVRDWLDARAGDPAAGLVLFVWHQATADAIADALPAGSCYVATGASTPTARQAMVDDFARGERRVFVASIAACGTGLNGLHRRTTACAFAEAPWVPGELIQAIGRVRRFGSAGTLTTAHILVGADSLEDRVLTVVAEKLATSAAVLGDEDPARTTP